MGLPLLKEAFEPIEAAAIIPAAAPANDANDYRTRTVREARNMERAELEFRSISSRQMATIEQVTRRYIREGARIEDIVADLEEFRSDLWSRSDQLEDFIEAFVSDGAKIAENVSSRNIDDGKFLRRQIKKGVTHLKNFLLTSQKNADFLTALLADIDPEAQGGPEFSDPEALTSHLRQLGS